VNRPSFHFVTQQLPILPSRAHPGYGHRKNWDLEDIRISLHNIDIFATWYLIHGQQEYTRTRRKTRYKI
jgi:hypothetical protein